MFDFLKKKISGFIDGITKREESKEGPALEPVKEEPIPKIPETEPEPELGPEPVLVPKAETKKETPKPETKKEKKQEPAPQAQKKPEPKPEPEARAKKPEAKPAPAQKPAVISDIKKKPEPAPQVQKKPEPKPEPEARAKKPEAKPAPGPLEKRPAEKPKKQEPGTGPEKEAGKPEAPGPELPRFKPEEKRGEKPQVRLNPLKAITSFITREVEISETDVRELLENLELELLESDVELGVAESIRQELTQKLVGAKVGKGELNDFVKDAIRGTLLDTMTSGKGFDLPEYVRSREKPVKIVFLGVNGSGKTTTIAKVAHMLMQAKLKVVFAAADTFRAAAIEQMEAHATKLDVRLIKRDYGSDPTSVAYDAMNYAKAHGIDAVLIDTAGRQDTNVNLINELKKMDRVIKPDLKIYIGESIAGSSIIGQVSAFNREIGVDGVILTKLDCDPKGGTVISISRASGIPILYIGTGQKYGDIERFDAAKMVDRILS